VGQGEGAGPEGGEGGRIDVCEACVREGEMRGEGGGRASPSKGLAFMFCVACGLVCGGDMADGTLLLGVLL